LKAGLGVATLCAVRLSATLTIVLAALATPARACPYEETLAVARADEAQVADAAAAHAAHDAELLGANAAWTTGLMARRVISDGRDWSFTGQITATGNDLPSRVAAPYRTQAAEGAMLVGTELLENLILGGHSGSTLKLAGRSLRGEDGVVYVVITRYQVINS